MSLKTLGTPIRYSHCIYSTGAGFLLVKDFEQSNVSIDVVRIRLHRVCGSDRKSSQERELIIYAYMYSTSYALVCACLTW